MKILVIQQKMIGDVLTSSILFEALKRKFPKAELHYLINSHTLPVVENHPHIDAFLLFTPKMEASKLEIWHLIKKVRKEQYEIVIDVYAKLSSNLITFFSGAAQRISYYKSYTWFFYTDTVKRKDEPTTRAGLAIENRIQLLEPLGLVEEPIPPKIYLTQQEKQKAFDILQLHGLKTDSPIFMISLLGSGPAKTYPFHYMAEIIDHICMETKEAQILFNYIPGQIKEARDIFELCSRKAQKQIFFNVFGKGLRDFLGLTSFCTAMIGNEGGAINMAKALNIPTFSIFSPWIEKSHWSVFDNGTTNVSVHLQDYNKVPYQEIKKYKHLKKQSRFLYTQLKPELFKTELSRFLNRVQKRQHG